MRAFLLAILVCLLGNTPAQAHLVGMEFGDFYAGALHLIVAPEHLAVLIGLSVVAAFQKRDEAKWSLAALPVGLLVGAGAGAVIGGADPAVLMGTSLALTGAIGAAALHLGRLPFAGLVLVVGLLHGYANGVPAADGAAEIWLYTTGVASAGTVIGTVAIAGSSALLAARHWTAMGYRVAGGWLVAIGTMYAGLSLAA